MPGEGGENFGVDGPDGPFDLSSALRTADGRVDDADVQDFFTGWGIRTLAAGQHHYHPMSYHNGSVWPRDTMLAAEGMATYGFTDEARRVASGMQDAAAL